MTDFSEHRFETDDGLSLYYRDYSGPTDLPVLCLHGLTRNCRDFEDLAPYLADRHRVLALDFRGRGHSERDPDQTNYHPAVYTTDVIRMLASADLDRVALIGTSLGGIVSMALANVVPDKVAGIVLNDIGPEIAPEGLERILRSTGRSGPVADWDGARARVRETYQHAWPDLDDAMWARIAHRRYRAGPDGVPVLDMDPAIGDAARSGSTRDADPWALFDGLADVPTLLLHGELSDIMNADIAGRMREHKPDLEYVVVANRGHEPLLDEPESIAAIDRFLAGLA